MYYCAVWAFDTDSECWSLMDAKGDVPVIFQILNDTIWFGLFCIVLLGYETAGQSQWSHSGEGKFSTDTIRRGRF